MSSARETAMRIIYDVEFNGAYSNIALKKALKSDISKNDKALITNIVYGVVDRKITLDYIIEQFSKIKLKKISKYILVILRMGIYQLMFMDKIPQSAAVNESVKLARRYGHGASAGFVNGLLRTVAKSNIEYPSDKTEYLSVMYSFPMWLCNKWVAEFGYDFTEEMLKSFQAEKKLTIRPNRLKITVEELQEKMLKNGINTEICDGYLVSDGFDISNDVLYNDGGYTIQDAAAMQAAIVLAPNEGDTVIDMCAAPGGKTTHLAELMNNKGKIYAFDVHEHKLELIRKNAERLGISIIEASLSDGRILQKEFLETADKVLCDVPCSGLGIIGRKPEIKWNVIKNGNLPEIQKQILNNASKYLRIGGEIVYSTCTIEREENEGVTGDFLAENDGFTKAFEKTYYPHKDNTDGFYICKMKRVK